jgi:hypothetical protein
MGLDSIWILPGEDKGNDRSDELPYFDPELHLVTGILFDTPRSFRGKTYSELIELITGVSLYQEEITNAKVKQMATALEEHVLKEADREFLYLDDKEQEYTDLKRMFRAFADAGASLNGWW